MNIHEYQAKELIRRYGVAVLDGHVAWTPEEAVEAARKLPGPVFVVKSQIHAGGRGAGILMGETQGFIDRQLTPERVRDAIAAGRDAQGFTPFSDYVSSAALLMELLGHAPGEPLAPLTYSKPGD